ncbi:MAG TPA: hypothetical protein VIL35_13605 [Vicinamibacterales bacterium]
MHKAKLAGYAALALVVAFGLGWAFGRSGTSEIRDELATRRLRMMLVEARAQILDAQVNLYTANFGNASRHLEYARPSLAAAAAELRDQRQTQQAERITQALQALSQAQELAVKLNQDANSRAGEAARLIGEVLASVP